MAATPLGKLEVTNITEVAGLHGDLSHISDSHERYLWQAWFDGAALPNPGKIGLGAVLVSPTGERHEISVLAGVWGCNNEAELLAALRVLELSATLGATRIRLCGDSDFAVRAGRLALASLNGLLQTSMMELTQIPRLVELLERLKTACQPFEHLDWQWLPRHRNGEADRLSRQALGLPHKPAALPDKRKSSRRR